MHACQSKGNAPIKKGILSTPTWGEGTDKEREWERGKALHGLKGKLHVWHRRGHSMDS